MMLGTCCSLSARNWCTQDVRATGSRTAGDSNTAAGRGRRSSSTSHRTVAAARRSALDAQPRGDNRSCAAACHVATASGRKQPRRENVRLGGSGETASETESGRQLIPSVRRHHGHSYARHGGCRRRRDRRDRVRYVIPLRASRFRGVGSVEAGPAANNPGPRAVLRQHAPSATRQRTLEANGIDCGASVLGEAAYAASGTARAGSAVQSRPREGTSIGVAAPASVLQVSVRGRLVAPARLFRFLGRGITGARRLLAFALFPIVASAELGCLLVGQDVLPC